MKEKAITNKGFELVFFLILFFCLKAIPNHGLLVKSAIIIDLIVIAILAAKIISQIAAKRKGQN